MPDKLSCGTVMTISHICRSIEKSAGSCQSFLTFPGVVWNHGVSKPSCGVSDGRSSISHGIELVQPHGSNLEGMRSMSAAAVICRHAEKPQLSQSCFMTATGQQLRGGKVMSFPQGYTSLLMTHPFLSSTSMEAWCSDSALTLNSGHNSPRTEGKSKHKLQNLLKRLPLKFLNTSTDAVKLVQREKIQ